MSKLLIETWPAIAKAIGRSERTAQRWAKLHGFPVAPAPNGHMVTTETLINQWILARAKLYRNT